MAQIYAGKRSPKLVAYGMTNESQMPNTLEDLIREHGAPNCLFSNNAKVQISAGVRDILHLYKIKDFQCETEHQNQNFAERKVGDVKRLSSAIMDCTGTSAAFWLLCLFYVVFLLNHMSSEALGGIAPLEAAAGVKADLSPLLQFHWWEPVFYQAADVFILLKVVSNVVLGLALPKLKAMSLPTLSLLTTLNKSLLAPTFAPLSIPLIPTSVLVIR
jgi:hypothetical protein